MPGKYGDFVIWYEDPSSFFSLPFDVKEDTRADKFLVGSVDLAINVLDKSRHYRLHPTI